MSDGVLTFKAFNCDISKVISSRGLDTGGKEALKLELRK